MSTPFLSNEQIQKMAPSVFAPEAHKRVSEKYQYISTLSVVDLLRNEGWHPVRVQQARVRQMDRYGYQKHLIRFRRDGQKALNVGDSIAELVLRNAHDGSSAYALEAGLYRLVCKNGMTVGDSLFRSLKIRHIGFHIEQIISASHKLIQELPRIADSVEGMRRIRLNDDERVAFADAALRLRYPDGNAPITARQLLIPRRAEDREPSLWLVLNIVQESLMRGQIEGRSVSGRRMQTRAIQSIDQDLRINKGLWEIAESFRRGAAEDALPIAA
jgi:hypothetical protein